MKKILKISKLLIAIIGITLLIILPINVKAYNVEIDPKQYISMPTLIQGESGTITISSSVTSAYDLYYQCIDISDSTFNQIENKISECSEYIKTEQGKLDEELANVNSLETKWQKIKDDSSSTDEQKQKAENDYKTASTNYKTHIDSSNAKIEEYNADIKALEPSYIENNWIKTTDGKFNIDTSKYTGKFHFMLWAKLVVDGETYYDEEIYSTQGTKEITISLDKTTVSIEKGKTLKLNATTSSSKTITWSSNKTDIATVSDDGTVTAKAKGTATITATVEGKKATCTVTVTEGNSSSDNESGDITDFSNAKFTFDNYTSYNNLKGKVENVNFNKDYYYYIYISKNKNDNPKYTDSKATQINTKDNENTFNILGENTRNILELKGKNYIYIIQKDKLGNQEVVLNAKEMQNLEMPAIGNRLDIYLHTSSATIVYNKIGISDNRKITYKIGKITSNDILKSFKNDSSTKAFNSLLKYAKSAKYLKTGNITTNGLKYNIATDLKLEKDGYYFIYMIVDTENGKYTELEDVAIYKAGILNNKNILWHFAYKDINVDNEKEDKTSSEDKTVSNVKLPKTGRQILVTSMAIIILVGGAVMYKKYRKYKGI